MNPRCYRVAAAIGAAGVVLAFALPSARAQRPTDPSAFFSYDETDVLDYWDEPTGAVRVHFSVSGPNVTVLDDANSDGVPDYPYVVATTTAAVIAFFEGQLGFRRPVAEVELGLDLGGSAAFDVYLIDFGGNADGSFGVDDCIDGPIRCSGYFSMENDFLGYNYPSLEYATNVLTSHELFHGVQYAYTLGLPVWFSEGTATWAEKQWDSDSVDFLWFTDAFLEDTGRSLDRPPGGPVPSFAYGTGLWFDFLSLRYGSTVVVDLLNAVADTGDGVDAMAKIEEVLGGPEVLAADWIDFVSWNLASGPRAGALDAYPYAGELLGITATDQGSAIDSELRFFPLAATYYRLDHAGGPLYFGAGAAAPELTFGLHPVVAGAGDGPVEPAIATWTADSANSWAVAGGESLPAGGYWMWVSKPARSANSTRVRICLGSEATALACAPLRVDQPPIDQDGGGCTIGAAPRGGTGLIWSLVALLGLVAIRRR